MVRMGPATPDEVREAFGECLANALRGEIPESDTGIDGFTEDTLVAVAQAAAEGKPTDQLVAAARAALDDAMRVEPDRCSPRLNSCRAALLSGGGPIALRTA
jgi:hypothetical protein